MLKLLSFGRYLIVLLVKFSLQKTILWVCRPPSPPLLGGDHLLFLISVNNLSIDANTISLIHNGTAFITIGNNKKLSTMTLKYWPMKHWNLLKIGIIQLVFWLIRNSDICWHSSDALHKQFLDSVNWSGVHIDKNFTWDFHIDYPSKRLEWLIFLLNKQVKKYCSNELRGSMSY